MTNKHETGECMTCAPSGGDRSGDDQAESSNDSATSERSANVESDEWLTEHAETIFDIVNMACKRETARREIAHYLRSIRNEVGEHATTLCARCDAEIRRTSEATDLRNETKGTDDERISEDRDERGAHDRGATALGQRRPEPDAAQHEGRGGNEGSERDRRSASQGVEPGGTGGSPDPPVRRPSEAPVPMTSGACEAAFGGDRAETATACDCAVDEHSGIHAEGCPMDPDLPANWLRDEALQANVDHFSTCKPQYERNACHIRELSRELLWLRSVIRTGGAMYRAERAKMGIPGGIDPDDALGRGRPTATHTTPEQCPECEGTGTIEACDPYPAMRCHVCEPPSEDVLRIVHAFDDQERKDLVRELAARVKATETALATLRQGRESDPTRLLVNREQFERICAAAHEAREVLRLCGQRQFPAPEDAEVKAIGERLGFGALMDAASKGWREKLAEEKWPEGGEFMVGPCRSTVERTLRLLDEALKEEP
jgi:hypothetical protein